MSKLTNKVAVITGGGSGVGQATAKLFLQEGAKVAIAGRDAAKLAKAIEAIPGGDKILVVPTDVTDPMQVKNLFERVTKQFGRVDILVNNAGVNLKARKMRELSIDSWNLLVRTNLDGAFYCIKEVLPQMLDRKEGLIVNVNSTSGKRPVPLAGAGYAAGKMGLHALASCLANEEIDSGIRVSSIYPGEIDTPILEARPTPVSDEQRSRILKAEDVAAAILFVSTLPAHVTVPELIIKPTSQVYF